MATFYLDIYDGNDANDGLTVDTPKKTLSAASNLVTAYTDEIKVRGKDDLYSDVGSWRWINRSLTLEYIGADKTGDVPAGTHICKTVTGNSNPEVYKVASVAYDSGTTATTITLVGTAESHVYLGTTEEVPTSKINLPSNIVNQVFAKDGVTGGTSVTDYTGRIFPIVSGGWSSGYTSQTSKTIMYNSSTSIYAIGDTTGRKYWHIKDFLILGYIASFRTFTYMNHSNCVYGWTLGNATSLMGMASNYYGYITNCFINGSYAGLLGAGTFYRMTNTKALNAGISADAGIMSSGGSNDVIDCILGFQKGTTSSTKVITGNALSSIYDNEFYTKDSPFCGSTTMLGIFTGNTFTDIGTTDDQKSVAFANGSIVTDNVFILNLNKTGCGLGNSCSGLIKYNTGLQFAPNSNAGQYLNLYNSNNEDFKIDNITGATSVVINGFNLSNNSVIYEATGNTRLTQYGYMKTGSDGYGSSTSSLKLHVQSSQASCDFTTVDFIIDVTKSYDLTYWIKANTGLTMNLNIYNGGAFVKDTWVSSAVTTSYTQHTINFASADWNTPVNMDGTATLVYRIPNMPKGTIVTLSNIKLQEL
jgi:hypothetical protein